MPMPTPRTLFLHVILRTQISVNQYLCVALTHLSVQPCQTLSLQSLERSNTLAHSGDQHVLAMVIITSNLTAWELDSRTATFHRSKRPHDLTIGDDHSSSGSAKSTPRKRARRVGKLGHQDVRDFVPVGASFSSTPIPLDEQAPSEDEGMHVGPSLGGEGLQNHDPEQDTTAQIPRNVHNGNTASENGRLGSPIPGDTMVFITEDQTLPGHDHPTKEVSTNVGAISKDEHTLGPEKDNDEKSHHNIGNARELTSSTIAPITWNPVNSIKIRTRLGGNSYKEAVEQVERDPKDEASGDTREKGQ